MRARDLMRPVHTCGPNHSLSLPVDLMEKNDEAFVVVVDAGKVVGCLTDRDVALGAHHTNRPLWGTPVRHSMVPAVIVRPEAPAEELERVLRAGRARYAVVLDEGGALQGSVSLEDVERANRADRFEPLHEFVSDPRSTNA